MNTEHTSKPEQESPEIIKACKQCLGALVRAEQALRKYYIAQANERVAPQLSLSSLSLLEHTSEFSQVLFKKYEHLRY